VDPVGVGGFVRGLEKNGFAGIGHSLPLHGTYGYFASFNRNGWLLAPALPASRVRAGISYLSSRHPGPAA